MAQVPALNTIAETLTRLPVSRPTIYKLIRAGELETVKIGRRRFVSDDAIANFIQANTSRRPAA
jgi:excisionase family DNA binding protein